MEYKPCEYVKYTGHKPVFNQSVSRVRYNFNRETGHICHVPNAEHMLFLVKRVHSLVPVVPVVTTEKAQKAKPERRRRTHAKK